MAAEARVAQASEAAKDAEERAASAAAHATAYQDMSQSLVRRVYLTEDCCFLDISGVGYSNARSIGDGSFPL